MGSLPENPDSVPATDIHPVAAHAGHKAETYGASIEQSWGDRFKKPLFNNATYTGVNYFLNAGMSTAIAYAVETYIYKKPANDAVLHDSALKPKASFLHATSRTILITTGGNILVFAIKFLEDHRQRFQFAIGHALDGLQEALGRGNGASSQNIADYAKIRQVLKTGSSADVTDEERCRWSRKYRIQFDASDKAAFKEHILPWHKALISRVGAFLSSFVLNAGIIEPSKKNSPWANYNHYADKVSSPFINVLSAAKVKLKDPKRFAEITFNEIISTVFSAVPHRLIQNRLHKEIPDSEFILDPAGEAKAHEPPTPAQEVRRKLVAGGQKNFLAREAEKPQKSYANIAG